MKSILEKPNQDGQRCCYLCGATQGLEKHHVFGGALRQKSEKYGMTVTLCHNCHNEPPHGVHFCGAINRTIKEQAQKEAMQYYGWSTDDFRQIFYKSYLLERSVKS